MQYVVFQCDPLSYLTIKVCSKFVREQISFSVSSYILIIITVLAFISLSV